MAYQRWILLKRQTSKGNRLAQKERRKAKQAEQKALEQMETDTRIRASVAALAAFLEMIDLGLRGYYSPGLYSKHS